MKESIRTASVLEIYNASIDELKKEKSSLTTKMNLLKASNTGAGFASIILYIFLSAISFFSLILIIAALSSEKGRSHDFTPTGTIILLVIGSSSILVMIRYSKYRQNKCAKNEKELQELNTEICHLKYLINEKETRKKSLLNAEEVIVAKDMKVVQDTLTTEKFSEETMNSELEKICPMCAETIKKAAKICRYCGHKFEIKKNRK